ncbi:MAG: hypothetical protein J2P17_10110 [Mycobacterium sp.]|nr:hypothetical protein [Mycobacterium sp.]
MTLSSRKGVKYADDLDTAGVLIGARAHLLTRAGRPAAAAEAYRRAIDLTTDSAVTGYLRSRLATLPERGSPSGQEMCGTHAVYLWVRVSGWRAMDFIWVSWPAS